MQNTIEKTERRGPFFQENKERKYSRTLTAGLDCDITDGHAAFGGTVENVCLGGFRLTNVPLSFDSSKYLYSILISGNDRHFRLRAKPCWRKREGLFQSQELGFKILDAPLEWVSYALSLTTEENQQEFQN